MILIVTQAVFGGDSQGVNEKKVWEPLLSVWDKACHEDRTQGWVGIANGPWETLGKQGLHQMELPPPSLKTVFHLRKKTLSEPSVFQSASTSPWLLITPGSLGSPLNTWTSGREFQSFAHCRKVTGRVWKWATHAVFMAETWCALDSEAALINTHPALTKLN